jgi:hypothetical protein
MTGSRVLEPGAWTRLASSDASIRRKFHESVMSIVRVGVTLLHGTGEHERREGGGG